MAVKRTLYGKKQRNTNYRDAKGITRTVKVLGRGTNAAHSVTITTTSGSKAVVATAGTFATDGSEIGADVSGNNTNTGAGNTVASVTDSTHATLTANAAATDAVGTATTFTKQTAKLRLAHRTTKVVDDVAVATSMKGTTVTQNRY